MSLCSSALYQALPQVRYYSMGMLQFIKMSPFLDPADFIGQSNVMVTFAPSDSASEQFVSVSVVNDNIVENNEMFTADTVAYHP